MAVLPLVAVGVYRDVPVADAAIERLQAAQQVGPLRDMRHGKQTFLTLVLRISCRPIYWVACHHR